MLLAMKYNAPLRGFPGRRRAVVTDMFGGTPTNIASMFLDNGNVEVVTA